jgi:hypothetical protein
MISLRGWPRLPDFLPGRSREFEHGVGGIRKVCFHPGISLDLRPRDSRFGVANSLRIEAKPHKPQRTRDGRKALTGQAVTPGTDALADVERDGDLTARTPRPQIRHPL